MADDALEVRNSAKLLLNTIQEMLAPVSVTPNPQRMKLDKAIGELEDAIEKYDRGLTLTRMQQLGQELENAEQE